MFGSLDTAAKTALRGEYLVWTHRRRDAAGGMGSGGHAGANSGTGRGCYVCNKGCCKRTELE